MMNGCLTFSYTVKTMMYQNRPLSNCVLDLVLLDQVLFVKGLNSIDLSCILLLAENDLAIGPSTDHLDQFELFNGQAAILNLSR